MFEYFDYAASTPISDIVLERMQPWLQHNFSNPSAAHSYGKKAYDAIEGARAIIADKIGAMPSEIIFTSGASEANNLAIKGIAFKYIEQKGHIITSSIEHKCILNCCAFLEKIGFEVTYIKPNNDGLISIESVFEAIQPNTILISIHHVNNELGCIQPIADIGHIAFDNNILFHTDAAQSFCKLDIDVDTMNLDMFSLSGHKIFGPKGIGALYIRDSRESGLIPLIHGGGQELGLRGGTYPTPLIVGLGAAVENFPKTPNQLQYEFEKSIARYTFLRNGGTNVVPTIWNITFNNDDEVKRFTHNQSWLISQGSACNAMSNIPSHVLTSIGFDEEKARRTFRISLPPYHINDELS
ncbi:cysteine desulfurase family protein [Scandinavium goeteborgense]|uniref:cysteine desulfurase family protein n=1 Tax=Scandinavium goeteborgense TaxID=1851514 RepID=UPI000F66B23A|nr:cysteine desulfurase family protein [Scandinavium goeteborgense]QKN83452.1 cysteine desulfurase [Scandinavium goeteborgense]